MAKVKIFPREGLMRRANGVYQPYGGEAFDVGSRTPIVVELLCTYSDYCDNSRCTYDLFQDTFTERQLDAIYREYTITYIDDNGCESDSTFSMVENIFTRPVDDVSSAHPKKINNLGFKYNGSQWWDMDSGFATTPSANCQGVCNGLALSCYTEFYEAYAYSDDPRDAIRTVTYTKVPNMSDWWCIPYFIVDNSDTFTGEQAWTARTDIFSGTTDAQPSSTSNNCYGLRYNREGDEPFYLPNRRSNALYITQTGTTNTDSDGAYSDQNGPQYRYGKFRIVLSNTVDSYSSIFNELNKIVNESGISISYDELCKCACLYYLDSYDDETFTARLSTTSGPRGFNPSNWFPQTISGKTVHFMSPVETFVYQKNISYSGPTTYTYMVTSNIVGATVEWTGATPIIDNRAGGNTNKINSLGYAKATNTTGGDVTVHISMDGYEFQYDGTYTLTEGKEGISMNGSSAPPQPTGCDYLEMKEHGQTDYTYTVRSNVENATVNFVNAASGDGLIKQIVNGSCSYTTVATSVTVTITSSDSSCVFNPSSTAMTNGGTATLNGTCGTPSTQCNDGSTAGLGSGGAVPAESSSTPVWIANWSKSPDGCDESWSYDSSRSISGTSFIKKSTLDFRSDGTIYAVVNKTNKTYSQRYCQIPTKLGSVKTDYFTVYQKAAEQPTPTNYTYTVSSNTVGAMVTLLSNGSQVGEAGTINDSGKFTLTTAINATLDIAIWKSGCTFESGKKVSPNSTTTVNGTCSTCDTCTDAGIGNLVTYSFDADAHIGALIATFTATCNPSFSVGYFQGSDIVTNWSVANVGGYNYIVLGDISQNTGAAKQEILVVGANASGSFQACMQIIVNQASAAQDPCLNEGLPNLSTTNISQVANVSSTHRVIVNSNCWYVDSVVLSNPGIMTYSFTGNVIDIRCLSSTPGTTANAMVNLKRSADGATGTREISAYWICPDCPDPSSTAITHPYNVTKDEYVTISKDCWGIYNVSVDQDPSGYDFVSARYANMPDYGMITISCKSAQRGYSARVTVYLNSKDGLNRKTQKFINVIWD